MKTTAVRRKESVSRRIFVVCNYFLCIFAGLLCLLPLVHVLSVSLSSKLAVFSGNVTFWPVDATLDNYRFVMRDSQFFRAYGVTLVRVAIGWAISMTLLVLAGYPLSLPRDRFGGKNIFTWFFVFTMLFNGGMIPTYLIVKSTGLIDTIWALVIPGSLSAFNLILMMNYFKTLPSALYEAAYIDGADHMTTLIKIVLPLSLPALASISLFVIMGHWNDYFSGMIYIRNPDLKPLQTYLRSVIIVEPSASDAASVESLEQNLTPDATNGAKIFLGLLPIMTLYPFLQKYFAKGIVRGSVKE